MDGPITGSSDMDINLQELLPPNCSVQDLIQLAQFLGMQPQQTQNQVANMMHPRNQLSLQGAPSQTVPQQPSSTAINQQTYQGLPEELAYLQTAVPCDLSPQQISSGAPPQQAYQPPQDPQFMTSPRNQTTDEMMRPQNRTPQQLWLLQQVGSEAPQQVYPSPFLQQPNQQTAGGVLPQQSTLAMPSQQLGQVQQTRLQVYEQTAKVESATQGMQPGDQMPVYCETQPQQAITGDSNLTFDDIMGVIPYESELDPSSLDALLENLDDGVPRKSPLPNDPYQLKYTSTALQPHQARPSTGATNAMPTAAATNHESSPGAHIAPQQHLTNQGGPLPKTAEQLVVIPQPGPSGMTNRFGEPIPLNIPVETDVPQQNNATKSAPSPNCGKTSQALHQVSSTSQTNKDQGAKKKTKSKRQRKPKSGDQNGPSSSLEIEPKKVKTSHNSTAAEGNANIPEGGQLEIRLFYEGNPKRTSLCGSDSKGCLIYHKKRWQFRNSDMNINYLEFPELQNDEQPPMSSKKREATIKLLEALAKGVYVRCDEGNVFATRFCQSHVYCYSTVPGPDFELVKGPTGNTSAKISSRRFFRKLPMAEEVMVFDFQKYHQILRMEWQEKNKKDAKENNCVTEPPLIPAIHLTFGQFWEAGFPLSNCLVNAKIGPLKACSDREVLLHVEGNHSFPCEDIETQMSNLSLTPSNGGSLQKQ